MQEYSQDYDAAEQNKLALAARRMQMQQAQSGMEEERAFSDLVRQYGGDKNALVKAAYGRGLYGKAQGVEKSIFEADKATADVGKTRADTAKADEERQAKALETATKRLQYAGQAFGYVKDNPSVEAATSVVQNLQQNGIWNEQQAAAAMAEIQSNPTPEGVRMLATRAFQGVLSAKDQLPQLFNQNRGGTFAVQAVNPVTMQAIDASSAPITQSADNAAAQETARLKREQDAKDAAAGRAVQSAGQRITRERLDFDRGTAVADFGGPEQAALVKKLGKPPKDYRWKADGSAEPIPGGPADLKSGEQGAKASAKRESQVAQAESVLGTIADAKKLVGYNTAGVGGLLAKVPMTDARNLQAKLETVKANLGFDRLQQMRDQSPTGGALGAVAVQELVALQSTVASLDQLQSPSEIGKALQKIEGHYRRWVDVMQQGQGGQGGASGSWGDKPAAGGVVDFGSLK
jgi:hypothetical protein